MLEELWNHSEVFRGKQEDNEGISKQKNDVTKMLFNQFNDVIGFDFFFHQKISPY